MKHITLTLLLIMAVSTPVTFAQDCKVLTSFLTRTDPDQSFDGLGGGRGQIDYKYTRQNRDHFVDSCGFSDDMNNTRYAICLNSVSSTRSLTLRVSLADTDNDIVLYSIILDTIYSDEDVRYLFSKMFSDMHTGVIPQYTRVLDTIRSRIIYEYEINTATLLKKTRKLVSDNDIEHAMFLLAQYPACCPSYPQVKSFIVASFREYVRKNHSTLLHQAKLVWDNQTSETDARFVVSLLNSEELSKSQRRKADRMLKKVAKEYPSIDINAHEDYTGTPELAAIAVKLSYKIGVYYSSFHAPKTFNNIPTGSME